MSFILTPNLPQKAVTHCLIGGAHAEVIADLCNLGITAIASPPFGNSPIASHVDMVCNHLGGSDILVYPYSMDFTATLKSFGLNVSHPCETFCGTFGECYPYDILLNAARVGEHLICNSAHTSAILVNHFTPQNIINTKQGYSKCSTLVVSPNAIVTSDMGIAKNALKKGIEVLHIRPGFITLEGYNYGFIGGCGTLISEKAMYFTGDIYSHPDSKTIVRFLESFGVKTICGSATTLKDVGSILPIIETN